jgi:predicted porin
VYGVAHASIDSIDVEGGKDDWEVESRGSRLGFKGNEDLGNGLKAVWQMEFQVDLDDVAGAANVTSRNQFVGLAGDWGTFVVGRHDTPYKISTGRLDLFADTAADYNATLAFDDVRANNAIAYISPSFNGLTFAGAVVPGENAGAADSIADAISLSLMYGNGPFYGAFAYETFSDDLVDGIIGTTGMPDADKWRLGLGYDMDAFHVGFVYEDQDVGSVADGDAWQISGSYAFGANVVKAMYGESDMMAISAVTTGFGAGGTTGGSDNFATAVAGSDSFAIGLDHNFSKRTKAYVLYSTQDDDTATTADVDVFSVGLRHSF